MGIPFPQEYGGGGADTLAYALVVEELARIDSSVAITLCAHISLGTAPIYMFGSEEQKREWLPALRAGRYLAVFHLIEPQRLDAQRQHAHDSTVTSGHLTLPVHHQWGNLTSRLTASPRAPARTRSRT